MHGWNRSNQESTFLRNHTHQASNHNLFIFFKKKVFYLLKDTSKHVGECKTDTNVSRKMLNGPRKRLVRINNQTF